MADIVKYLMDQNQTKVFPSVLDRNYLWIRIKTCQVDQIGSFDANNFHKTNEGTG